MNSHKFNLEELDKMKRVAKDLYSNVDAFKKDFEQFDHKQSYLEELHSLEICIRAGLLASDLGPDDINILQNEYGKNWYQKFNYDKNDIPIYDNQNIINIDLNENKK